MEENEIENNEKLIKAVKKINKKLIKSKIFISLKNIYLIIK